MKHIEIAMQQATTRAQLHSICQRFRKEVQELVNSDDPIKKHYGNWLIAHKAWLLRRLAV